MHHGKTCHGKHSLCCLVRVAPSIQGSLGEWAATETVFVTLGARIKETDVFWPAAWIVLVWLHYELLCQLWNVLLCVSQSALFSWVEHRPRYMRK